MAQLVVRDLPEDTKERLRTRAKAHGRSLEAEVRDILEAAARSKPMPPKKDGFGTRMQERFAKRGLTESEARQFNRAIAELRRSSQPRIPELD